MERARAMGSIELIVLGIMTEAGGEAEGLGISPFDIIDIVVYIFYIFTK
jgi:hypothetical protein